MNVDLFGNLIVADEAQYETKIEKKSPFDFVGNIAKKEYPEDLNGFIPFITNLAFSQRKDLVIIANEMNKYNHLSDQQQFDFYFHALPKKNLFAKWSKAEKIDLEAIKKYFDVSLSVAKEYQKTLKPEQIRQIQDWFDNREGGTK